MHYNGDNSYLLVDKKQTYKFKANNKNVNFSSEFCLRSISKNVDAQEASVKENIYDFSVNYDAIDKSDILNIENAADSASANGLANVTSTVPLNFH